PDMRLARLVALPLLLASCAPSPATTPVLPTAISPTVVPVIQPTSIPATVAPTATQAAPLSGPLIEASLTNLSKTLHPYPDVASYTQSWVDIDSLLWGGADGGGSLLAFDWNTLSHRPAMATDMPKVSSDGKTFTFTLRDDLKWSDGSPITVDDF